jgi:hypothetical protein
VVYGLEIYPSGVDAEAAVTQGQVRRVAKTTKLTQTAAAATHVCYRFIGERHLHIIYYCAAKQ